MEDNRSWSIVGVFPANGEDSCFATVTTWIILRVEENSAFLTTASTARTQSPVGFPGCSLVRPSTVASKQQDA